MLTPIKGPRPSWSCQHETDWSTKVTSLSHSHQSIFSCFTYCSSAIHIQYLACYLLVTGTQRILDPPVGSFPVAQEWKDEFDSRIWRSLQPSHTAVTQRRPWIGTQLISINPKNQDSYVPWPLSGSCQRPSAHSRQSFQSGPKFHWPEFTGSRVCVTRFSLQQRQCSVTANFRWVYEAMGKMTSGLIPALKGAKPTSDISEVDEMHKDVHSPTVRLHHSADTFKNKLNLKLSLLTVQWQHYQQLTRISWAHHSLRQWLLAENFWISPPPLSQSVSSFFHLAWHAMKWSLIKQSNPCSPIPPLSFWLCHSTHPLPTIKSHV